MFFSGAWQLFAWVLELNLSFCLLLFFPGEEFYETSPYEPIHFSEEFRHASIISGNCCLAWCLFFSMDWTDWHIVIKAAAAALSDVWNVLGRGNSSRIQILRCWLGWTQQLSPALSPSVSVRMNVCLYIHKCERVRETDTLRSSDPHFPFKTPVCQLTYPIISKPVRSHMIHQF